MLLQKDRRKLLLKALKNARLEAGMRQADVALALSRPQSYIAKIESGERKIDFIEVIDLCNIIDLDVKELLGKLK
jgi:transcriptional regulator with XRE-family HTH domain